MRKILCVTQSFTRVCITKIAVKCSLFYFAELNQSVWWDTRQCVCDVSPLFSGNPTKVFCGLWEDSLITTSGAFTSMAGYVIGKAGCGKHCPRKCTHAIDINVNISIITYNMAISSDMMVPIVKVAAFWSAHHCHSCRRSYILAAQH